MTEKELKYHHLYMDVAIRTAQMSHCTRRRVGAILVKNDRIISMGWNGMPSGMCNTCEDDNGQTKDEVLHAEANLIAKLARSTESGEGSDLYVTCAPCIHCAKLIMQIGISRVFYKEKYRSESGISFLQSCNVAVFCVDENS